VIFMTVWDDLVSIFLINFIRIQCKGTSKVSCYDQFFQVKALKNFQRKCLSGIDFYITLGKIKKRLLPF
jgi:hypothetical protein